MDFPRLASVATATPRQRFTQTELLQLAGYDDTNAADRLAEGTQRFGRWPPANGGRRASRSPQPSTGSRDGGPSLRSGTAKG